MKEEERESRHQTETETERQAGDIGHKLTANKVIMTDGKW